MISKENLTDLNFPHDTAREHQDQLILDIDDALKKKKRIIAHAPTGLGKTASAIAPALTHAVKNKLTIFFLTSRHTQHQIAIDTLKMIKDKHKLKFNAVDIIGRKGMCSEPNIDKLYWSEFIEYCKLQREEGKCEFYNNTKTKTGNTIVAKRAMDELKIISPFHVEKLIECCAKDRLCPYEIATSMAAESDIIISDYNYIFNSHIRDSFFQKANKELGRSILIVDEAHNLPSRMREMMTQKLSTTMIKRAVKEATKFNYKETIGRLNLMNEILQKLIDEAEDNERLVTKQEFIEMIEGIGKYDDIISDLEFLAESVRETQKQSYLSSIALFLESWLGNDEGFARIITKGFSKLQDQTITLSYRCLDPSLVTKEVFQNCYSAILMSGTLMPTEMYKDLLGMEDAVEKMYKSPFLQENRLNLIVPKTTTKFTERNQEQFKKIAEIIASVVNRIPGNSAVYFPSYFLRDEVNRYFEPLCKKTTFFEEQNLTKKEKAEMIERFKKYKDPGATMLAVVSGNFSEGIDLPGDYLKGVIVVGLPLNRPDLETKELIKYYDLKFGKGWDYGYVYPAFIKCLQSAGRCIRSETDRGIVVFLDERYTWRNYFKNFPADIDIKITKNPVEMIDKFFENK